LFTFLKIWIFAPKLSFSETFCHYGGFKFLISSCLFTFFSCLFTFVSCLFTFFSAVCLLFLKIWILAPKRSFSETFCHYGGFKFLIFNSLFTFLLTLSAVYLHFSFVCLHFQLFVLIFFSCLFTFLKITSLNSTFWQKSDDFSAVCLHFFSCLFTFLKIWILAPKLSFSETFCHYGGLSPKLWNFETFFSVFSSFLNFQIF